MRQASTAVAGWPIDLAASPAMAQSYDEQCPAQRQVASSYRRRIEGTQCGIGYDDLNAVQHGSVSLRVIFGPTWCFGIAWRPSGDARGSLLKITWPALAEGRKERRKASFVGPELKVRVHLKGGDSATRR